MSIRTIMIFPQFENIRIIDDIRKRYDPLSELIRPHITLVFPFESDLTNEELAEEITNKISTTKPFILRLSGISKCNDQFGNYIFLNVKKGKKELIYLHDSLYSGILNEHNLGLKYIPHMTVGKLSTVEEMDMAYDVLKRMEIEFDTVVYKISVEMIGENDESIIIIEKNL